MRGWQTYRYVRRELATGRGRVAERGFLSRTDFLGHLALWNRQQPQRWAYEPVEPALPSGWSDDLVTVRDLGEAS